MTTLLEEPKDFDLPVPSDEEDLGSADSLVAETYPDISPDVLRSLKARYRLPNASANDVARSLLRLADDLQEKGLPSTPVTTFLEHVSLNGKQDTDKTRAAYILSAFFHLLDTREKPERKRKLKAVSGYEWSADTLNHFNIVFNDVDEAEFGSSATEKSTQFIAENAHITHAYIKRPGTAKKTRLHVHLEFVSIISKRMESAVDDMVVHLLESVLPDDLIVKTRLKMDLQLAKSKKEATADVIVIKLDRNVPKGYKIGIVVVEDKAKIRDEDQDVFANTEAQLISEGIATCQQESWVGSDPIVMIRVVGTLMTFYKARFTTEFLNDVKVGDCRLEPFTILRNASPIDSDGYDLLDPLDRPIICQILANIGETLILTRVSPAEEPRPPFGLGVVSAGQQQSSIKSVI